MINGGVAPLRRFAGGVSGRARRLGSTQGSAVLFGILLSVAIAITLVHTTKTEPLLGVCIALLGTVLTVLYGLYMRFEDRADVESHRSALLVAALDEKPWLLRELREIATYAKGMLNDHRNARLFEDLISARIRETRAYMQELQRGHIRVPAGDVTPMANQIDLVRETVLATTIPEIDTDWWLSLAGRDYLERNRKAIKDHKVLIQRIVLWEKGSSGLKQMIEEQREAGVHISFARRKGLPDELNTNMAIYDESSYNDVVFNADRKDIYYEYYLDPDDAKKAVARFEKLRGLSSEDIPPLLEKYF
jgi:hypothetical protein